MIKTKEKLKSVPIKIIAESDFFATWIGVSHIFEIGDIIPAGVITKEYCEEHEGFIEGFFIQGHGYISDIYCTTEISKKDYLKYINKVSKKIDDEEKKIVDAEKEKQRLQKYLGYLVKNRDNQ